MGRTKTFHIYILFSLLFTDTESVPEFSLLKTVVASFAVGGVVASESVVAHARAHLALLRNFVWVFV